MNRQHSVGTGYRNEEEHIRELLEKIHQNRNQEPTENTIILLADLIDHLRGNRSFDVQEIIELTLSLKIITRYSFEDNQYSLHTLKLCEELFFMLEKLYEDTERKRYARNPSFETSKALQKDDINENQYETGNYFNYKLIPQLNSHPGPYVESHQFQNPIIAQKAQYNFVDPNVLDIEFPRLQSIISDKAEKIRDQRVYQQQYPQLQKNYQRQHEQKHFLNSSRIKLNKEDISLLEVQDLYETTVQIFLKKWDSEKKYNEQNISCMKYSHKSSSGKTFPKLAENLPDVFKQSDTLCMLREYVLKVLSEKWNELRCYSEEIHYGKNNISTILFPLYEALLDFQEKLKYQSPFSSNMISDFSSKLDDYTESNAQQFSLQNCKKFSIINNRNSMESNNTDLKRFQDNPSLLEENNIVTQKQNQNQQQQHPLSPVLPTYLLDKKLHKHSILSSDVEKENKDIKLCELFINEQFNTGRSDSQCDIPNMTMEDYLRDSNFLNDPGVIIPSSRSNPMASTDGNSSNAIEGNIGGGGGATGLQMTANSNIITDFHGPCKELFSFKNSTPENYLDLQKIWGRKSRWLSLKYHLIQKGIMKITHFYTCFPIHRPEFMLTNSGTFGPIEIGFSTEFQAIAIRRLTDFGWGPEKCDELEETINQMENLKSTHILQSYIVKDYCGHSFFYNQLCDYNLEEFLEKLKNSKELNEYIAKDISFQIVKGLAALHNYSLQIIHGNLKLSNIFIDENRVIKLAEFGIFKFIYKSSEEIPIEKRIWWATECHTWYKYLKSYNCTTKSDIQTCGMILNLINSGGTHPYGNTNEEIIHNLETSTLNITTNSIELWSLLNIMLSPNPCQRPEISEVVNHVYFWDDAKKWDFILTCLSIANTEYEPLTVTTTISNKFCSTLEDKWTQDGTKIFWMAAAFIHFPGVEIPYGAWTDSALGLLRFLNKCRYEQPALFNKTGWVLKAYPELPCLLYNALRRTHWFQQDYFNKFNHFTMECEKK